ncbi:MAG: Gfo/Idh/MocA family oxidoreductase [Abitibacteriaceae bacterium]|nr:Gfo/Idh/MocA family oxidoreductase [Abditibacteriaceae bacterium]MBV9865147.1 Gfo/Idh/MocA family oxidoreductase [Abditibacteriaceae bacterium]
MTSIATDISRIGIIGTGNRGINCFGALLSRRNDAQVVALADSNPLRMEAAAQQIGQAIRCYNEPEAMLKIEALDGVVITTPDFQHARYVLAALAAGVRHVLVDKPLATNVADALRIERTLQEVDAQLAIGFNMRHLPIICRIKEIIENGEIGDLMLIENREFYDGGRTYMARWNRRYEWSGGLWVHKGSHDFDVFNWWNAGGNPVRVSASAGVNALRPDKIPFAVVPDKPVGPHCSACAYAGICPDYAPISSPPLYNAQTSQADGYWPDLCVYLSDKNTHDNGIALVEYDNNVRASHLECFICNFTDRFYTVVGDRGVLMANLENPTQIELRPRWGENKIIDVPLPDAGGHGGADPLLVENFVASIQGQRLPSSNVRDGIRSVAVGQAAEIAWREQRTVEVSELLDTTVI